MSDDLHEELPREEALIRLYELRDRLDKAIAARGVVNPRSESERHRQEHGHALAFGCCDGRTNVVADADGRTTSATHERRPRSS